MKQKITMLKVKRKIRFLILLTVIVFGLTLSAWHYNLRLIIHANKNLYDIGTYVTSR